MTRFYPFVFLGLLVLTPPVRGQAPLGSVAKSFPINASKLLADPVRNRVYAAVPAINSVEVIDTTTLAVTATVAVGSDPVDMSISPDNRTLYVANNGSTLAAIVALDLDTLTVTASLPLSDPPTAIAAGLDGRLYVLASTANYSSDIYQLDAATGSIQANFNTNSYRSNLLALTPDGKTLLETDNIGDLKSFDVSTATPMTLKTTDRAGSSPTQIVISHGGTYFCAPGSNQSVLLYSIADIADYYGSFNNISNTVGAAFVAFSPDDARVYEAASNVLDVFDTRSFVGTDGRPLPSFSSSFYIGSIRQMVIDRTGSYLFISGDAQDAPANAAVVYALATGTGTLTPSSVLPVINSATSANGYANAPFNYRITATNAPTSFGASGLPAGLSVDPATGIISGTLTGLGGFSATLSASNASGTATSRLSVQIDFSSPGSDPIIDTPVLPIGTLGQAYHATLTATNGPTDFIALNLPDGLIINAESGAISGTPTLSGVFYVTFNAENNYGNGYAVLPLCINSAAPNAPVVTGATGVYGTVGTPFSFQVAATNSPSGYTASGLPPGLGIDPKAGMISGTPTTASQFTVILGATNAAGMDNAVLLLTISTPPVASPLVGSGMAAGTVGVPFNYQIAATNAPTLYGISGNLPRGLTLDAGNGVISGTPTVAGTFNVTLSVSNSGGTGQGVLTLTVAAPATPVITSPAMASATVNLTFSFQVTASGTVTNFDAQNLPPGLTIDHATGLISGTPTTTGGFDVNISVTNAGGTVSGRLTLTVSAMSSTVDVMATAPRVTAGSGGHAEITFNRTGDLSRKLTVAYSIKGSARNGVDYFTISGKQKIKPNKTSSTLQIIPKAALSEDVPRVVRITIQPAAAYQVGLAAKAKVKIVPGGE